MSKEFEEKVLEELNNMNKKMDRMNEQFTNKIDEVDKRLTGRMDEMNKEFTEKIVEVDNRLTGTMKEMNKTLVLIEYKMETEFPALYEIYSMNYKKQKENEKEIKSVAKTASKNSIHITHLYETLRDHEEQLRKLSS